MEKLDQSKLAGRFEKAGRLVDSYLGLGASVAAGLAMAFFGTVASRMLPLRPASFGWGGLCLSIALLYVVSAIMQGRRTVLVERLQQENADLKNDVLQMGSDHREHCSRQLMTIGEDLGFRGSDRVSLYKFDNGQFVMLGRHAERPELKAPGRGVYPADQGLIGVAWNSTAGRCFVDDLPDPATDLDAYKRANFDRFSFPPEVVDTIAMKSRTLAAYVLKDHGGVGRAALILFESLEAGRFDDNILWKLISGHHGRSMSLLLDVMKPREPSPALARERGF